MPPWRCRELLRQRQRAPRHVWSAPSLAQFRQQTAGLVGRPGPFLDWLKQTHRGRAAILGT